MKTTHAETLAIHAGRAPDPATGAVTPNLIFSSTFARDDQGQLLGGHIYSRTSNPNRTAVETALAALEGGAHGLAFASGQAASAAIFAALAPSDRVLLPDDLYHGTRYLATNEFGRWGLVAEFIDTSDLAAVAAALQKPARVVWLETPSNPRLKISDLAAVAQLARAAGALVVADNTWATPVLTQPLALGAHIVLHSTTKYLGGHSDLLGGALVLGTDAPADLVTRLRSWQNLAGAVPAPFDCWLLLRSLSTLPLRVRAQSATAANLAAWLAGHPKIERVYYPGLSSHPNHTVATQQMSAFGGMLSFEVRGGHDAAKAVACRVQLITQATSLGGVESLIEHRRPVEGPASVTPPGLLRFSVGLEHLEDLRADLAQALG
ncbi:MAG: aminotransferase class I/II-fold pyridoxal phosphate-dependent enzyme [Opitutae bacterium]|nr:aminotransferase class I/II-fold pyridoxal phosphate-dependent enzyme [Opitutae bacterium]